MPTIAEKQAHRERLLAELYKLTDGDTQHEVLPDDLAGLVGIGPEEFRAVIGWHESHGNVVTEGLIGAVRLTHFGVDRAERLLEQAGSTESAPVELLTVVSPEQKAVLEALATQLTAALDSGEVILEPEDEAEARVQIDTIVTQLRSPRPRAGVVGTALKVLTWVGNHALAGVIEGTAFAGVVAALTQLA